MNVEFDNGDLSDLYLGNFKKKPKYPEGVITKYRKIINFINNAENFKELTNQKSWKIEKKTGWGFSAIWINKQYRIEFTYDKETITILVLKLSKHYEK